MVELLRSLRSQACKERYNGNIRRVSLSIDSLEVATAAESHARKLSLSNHDR